MAFLQIIEFTTDDIDAVRQIVTRDRNQPNRYLAIVFFDSYESAMKNSELPETQEISAQYQEATDSVAFHDLDVISDEEV